MSNQEETSNEQHENDSLEDIAETEIDISSLTDDEKDALILEMQQQEMMAQQQTTLEQKPKIKTKKRRKTNSSTKNIAPGFGWIAIKMGTAMTLSMTFIFLGPLLIIMALFRTFNIRGVYDWFDLLWGLVGVGLSVAAYFLFRYIIKD